MNKAEVVVMDETEAGERAKLNLGHTFGHAIETGLGYGEWLHGEAVSVGTVMASDMSFRLGWIDENLFQRIRNILVRAKLPVLPPKILTTEAYLDLMGLDKKVANGVLRLILLKVPFLLID